MGESKKSFVKDLDLLVELLKKLKEGFGKDNQDGLNQTFFESIDEIMVYYHCIKDDVSEKLLNQFGEPIHTLLTQIINEIRGELKEPQSHGNNISMDLIRIDELLASPDIRDDEINRLLDRRSELLALKFSLRSNN